MRSIASIERGEGEADQSFSMLVFQRHAGGLVERYSTVKAHAKDCGRILSSQYIGKIDGEKAFSSRILNGLYLDPAQVPGSRSVARAVNPSRRRWHLRQGDPCVHPRARANERAQTI